MRAGGLYWCLYGPEPGNLSKLLKTLENVGVGGVGLYWSRSFAQNRFQYVKIISVKTNYHIEDSESPLQAIMYGIPQGSTLGPLLFICYLKGFPGVVSVGGLRVCG